MTIDIENLSAKELQALIAKASQRKKKLAKRKPLAQVKKELTAVAKKAGYTLAEIFGGSPRAKTEPKAKAPRKSAGKRSKVAAKYRNPANTNETWTGRGKPPRWLASELAQGKQKADFLI